MRKASTALLEQGTQTPSPAPDLIPAESSTENLHWDRYSERGHFSIIAGIIMARDLDRADGLFGGPQGSPRTDKMIAAAVKWA
jgi:hypothetical protein